MGFCFSFPVKQTAVDAGTMIKLTKKFDNEGLVGCDPVQMLQQAIHRFKSPVSHMSSALLCHCLTAQIPSLFSVIMSKVHDLCWYDA